MRLAIFAAFPHELNRLRKNFGFGKKLEKGLFPLFSIRQRSCEIIAVQTGMRTDTLKAAFTHVREKYHPDMILSIGFCGALYSEAQIGDLVWASQYWHLLEGETNLTQGNAVMTVVPADFSSKKILEKLHAQIRFYEGSFITLSTWISKSRLIQAIPRDIPIPVCDRETYHLAQWSQQYRFPFFAVRSVTDRADEDISPELFEVADETGHYSLSRTLGMLIKRPSLIFESVKLGRHAYLASRSLSQAVDAFIEILSVPQSETR